MQQCLLKSAIARLLTSIGIGIVPANSHYVVDRCMVLMSAQQCHVHVVCSSEPLSEEESLDFISHYEHLVSTPNIVSLSCELYR